jgi:hypothetical protein
VNPQITCPTFIQLVDINHQNFTRLSSSIVTKMGSTSSGMLFEAVWIALTDPQCLRQHQQSPSPPPRRTTPARLRRSRYDS